MDRKRFEFWFYTGSVLAVGVVAGWLLFGGDGGPAPAKKEPPREVTESRFHSARYTRNNWQYPVRFNGLKPGDKIMLDVSNIGVPDWMCASYDLPLGMLIAQIEWRNNDTRYPQFQIVSGTGDLTIILFPAPKGTRNCPGHPQLVSSPPLPR